MLNVRAFVESKLAFAHSFICLAYAKHIDVYLELVTWDPISPPLLHSLSGFKALSIPQPLLL